MEEIKVSTITAPEFSMKPPSQISERDLGVSYKKHSLFKNTQSQNPGATEEYDVERLSAQIETHTAILKKKILVGYSE